MTILSQADLFTYAAQQRDKGMARAANAQERKIPGYGEILYDAIRFVAETREFVHIDDVLPLVGVRPSHPNANGAPWMRARKQRLIEPTGQYRPSCDPKKHAHSYPVFRSLVWRR